MINTRIKQSSYTGVILPKVKLLSMTDNPMGTLFTIWYGSRHSKSVSPSKIELLYKSDLAKEIDLSLPLVEELCKEYSEHAGESGDDVANVIYSVVKQLVDADLPPTESVFFNFEIDDANVAWREQLVRSKFASYWTQSTRTQDMTTIDVNMNDSVRILGGEKAEKIYKNTVDAIRKAYIELTELGVPQEDIRLQPQGHTHRVYWMISLRSLIKILNKRSDFLAQASLWTPIISGVCKILRETTLSRLVDDLVGKPLCEVSFDEDKGHYYISNHNQISDNEDRYFGRDPLPCDPLWLSYSNHYMPENTNIEFYDYLKSMYINIWNDNYLDVLGWDRNDPSKIGPYDRPKSYFDNHKEEFKRLESTLLELN